MGPATPKPKQLIQRGENMWSSKMKKLVNIKELKESYCSEYQKEYERYCNRQWEFPMDDEWYKECLNETPWLDVNAVYYSVSYSQGDYAFFTGHVDLVKFLEEKDTENEYFALREAMKLDDCCDRLYIEMSNTRNSGVVFNEIEWRGLDEGWFEDDDVLGHNDRTTSILEGMNYREYYDLCMDLMGDLYTWVKEVCEQRMNQLYYDIREDIDHQMSEEAFEEWAESMDEQFEVEVMEEAA
jgi:Rad3-related DNA helicase